MTGAPIERVLHSVGVPGELVEVHQVGGAWSNRVWSVRTTRRQYAVKEPLNPWQDPHWREWLDESIAFERQAIRAGVRAPMPVLTVDGAALVDLDGRTFRAHQWIADAAPCPDSPVPTKLAALVARELAIMHELHALPSRDDVFPQPTSATCDAWPDLVAQPSRVGSPYAHMARGVAPEIACVGEWFAHRAPDANRVMSHGDIDQKNMLLAHGGSAWLVDWDVAMPWRPEEEVLRTAPSLAVWRERPVVRRFFAAYRDAGGITPEPAPEKFSLDLVIGIDWLDRCLRIASGIQDVEPQRIDEAHKQASQGLRALPARVAIARNFPDWLATETP